MFGKHMKLYISFIINVARPISFSISSFNKIEINYDYIRSVLLYEHIMAICFSPKFAVGIPSK